MSAKSFSLLRHFTDAKFFSVAKQDNIRSALPRSTGVLLTTTAVPSAVAAQFLWGDIAAGGGIDFAVGYNNATAAALFAADVGGTPPAPFSTGLLSTNRQVTNPAGAAYTSNEQDLLNEFASIANGNAEIDPGGGDHLVRAALTPPTHHMVLLMLVEEMVAGQPTATCYLNGQQIGQLIYDIPPLSAAPFTLGASPLLLSGLTSADVAGVFFHAGALSEAEVAAMQSACAQAKDLVSPAGYITGGATLDYVWSVKQTNPLAATGWASTGAQPSVAMTRHGVWVPTGANADVYAADYPWA